MHNYSPSCIQLLKKDFGKFTSCRTFGAHKLVHFLKAVLGSDFFTPPLGGVYPHTMMDTPQTQTVTGTPLGGVSYLHTTYSPIHL